MGAAVFGIYALIFGALSVKHVSYALVALICMFAFEQWGAIYVPFVATNGTLVNIGILLLVAVAWFRLPAGSTFEFILYPTRTLMIVFLGYAFVTTVWSPPDSNATARFLNEIHYLVAALVIAPLLIRTVTDFSKVLDAVTWLGGSLVVLFAYVPDFEGRSLLLEYDLEETLGLPLALGDFAGFVLIVTFMRLRMHLLTVCWGLLVCGSALFLITKTGSRGQLFFAIATILVCLPVRWKNFSVNRFIAFVLVGLIAAGAVFIVVKTENTLSSRIAANDGDSLGTMPRVEMVQVLIKAWVDEPSAMLFGLGSSASWSRSLMSGYSHVVPVEILAELGIFGFALFSLAVLTLFLQAFTGNKKHLSDVGIKNFAALFSCWVFALLLSCKQGTLLYVTDFFMYAVLAEKCLKMGLIDQAKRTSGKRMSAIRRRASKAI